MSPKPHFLVYVSSSNKSEAFSLIELITQIYSLSTIWHQIKENVMSNPSDKKHFSLNSSTVLTEQQQADCAALNAMPDETIDFCDSPPLTEEFWQNAVRNPFYKPTETATIVHANSDAK